MTFRISVMTNYRTASHFRRERSRSLSLAYINTMSEQPEVGIFNRLFNAAARARQELAVSNDDSRLLSSTRRLFRRQVPRVRGKFGHLLASRMFQQEFGVAVKYVKLSCFSGLTIALRYRNYKSKLFAAYLASNLHENTLFYFRKLFFRHVSLSQWRCVNRGRSVKYSLEYICQL